MPSLILWEMIIIKIKNGLSAAEAELKKHGELDVFHAFFVPCFFLNI